MPPFLGIQSHPQRTNPPALNLTLRSGFKPRDDSPDSVILTHDSSFSLFSSASGSVDRCSFASDVHDHESFVSELSKRLAGSDVHECWSGPDLDPNNRSTVPKSIHTAVARDKAKECEGEERESEDDNQVLDSARNSFSRALRECQNRRFKPEVYAAVKKSDRQRPASLDLNSHRTNAIATSASPRFGGMKKSSVSSRKSGTFPSPGTPNYWQGTAGVQKGWSSERVPLPQNGGRRNVGTALLPFNSGRTLPSKWEDAEKWIFSPVSGDSVNRSAAPLPQRRPKSKSGPLGPPGIAYYSMYSPSIPMFERGNARNSMAVSPFSAGILVDNHMPGQGQRRVGCGNGGSYPDYSEPCMTRSASVHGWSSDRMNQSLPGSQDHADEKGDHMKEESSMVSRAVSRRDMATQMSPDGSRHSSPKESLSFSSSPPLLLVGGCHSTKLEVRDVQVDGRVTMTRWSRKHGIRELENKLTNVGDCRKESLGSRSSWDISDGTKCKAKSNREEAKITAWENLQKAKAEAAIRKLEMKLEKKRSSSMDKIMNKLRLAQKKAQDMRSSVSISHPPQVPRSSKMIISFRKRTQISSFSGCFTCHAI